MPLSQTGANYKNRAHILSRDRLLADALDDIMSTAQASLNQGNFSKNGTPEPPSSPSGISVTAKMGLFTVAILHPKAPAGTQWVLQYADNPQFQNPITVGLLHPSWQQSLPQQVLFFRAAAKFAASAQTPWVYLGTSAKPTSLTG
jgi:hypothetical protein